jgi:hypothetical protein
VIDKQHILLPASRLTGTRSPKQAVATATRATGTYREDHHQSGGTRDAGRLAHFPEHATTRQLAEDDRGQATAERRIVRDRRAAVARQILTDTMRPQRRASDDFPLSTFMAMHIAQEILPESDLHLDPGLCDHPGPALYRAAQDSLATAPRALSLSA